MSTDDFRLRKPPADRDKRELWLRHVAGFILLQDVRHYARAHIDPTLDRVARDAALKGIDDALYGMMMIIDGVTGALKNDELGVCLEVGVRLHRKGAEQEDVVQRVDLARGDEMCMGYHLWRDGDFGTAPVATPSNEYLKRLEADLNKLVGDLADNLSPSVKDSIRSLIDAGEYGVAFEDVCSILREENTAVPPTVASCLRQLAQRMDIDPKYWSGL